MAGNTVHVIKLFGKTINLASKQSNNRGEHKSSDNEEERYSNSVVFEECNNPGSPALTRTKNEEDRSVETSSSESQNQNTLKRPDKIIPCPRCNNMNTKFCYFNNYNVNQPRHFCKNCQRYWTAGGTMRSVPVGAGRRKNKAHHQTLVVPEFPDGLTHHGLVLDNPNLAWSPVPWGSRIPVPLYSTSNANWAPPAWNWQWVATQRQRLDQTSLTTNACARSLGKHARDNENAENGRVVIPKTFRIGDPNEAAKSSIRHTLKMRNEKGGCSSSNGFFGGFEQSEHNNRNLDPIAVEGTQMCLQTNPAAFSRSIKFNESARPTC